MLRRVSDRFDTVTTQVHGVEARIGQLGDSLSQVWRYMPS